MPDGSGTMHAYADIARDSAATETSLDWLAALRRDAAERYADQGLPGRRDEYWRYTNLNALAAAAFTPAGEGFSPAAAQIAEAARIATDAARIVFVNGRLRPELSALDGLPDGVTIGSLAEMLTNSPDRIEPWLGNIAETGAAAMAALNTAALGDGLVLFVADGVNVEAPIELVSVGAPEAGGVLFQPRNLVVLGDHASATLIEIHAGARDGAGYFANIVTEIAVGEGARLAHYKVQEDSPDAFHLALTEVRLADRAKYESFVLQSGGRIGRNETRVRIAGEGVDCLLDGIYLAGGDQVLDNTTLVDHVAPACRSRQVFKGVLDGASRGVFQGKIHVAREAQQTDGHQLSRALLLSPKAEIDARPELEIYADDVKCSHGATAGDLDDDAMFYLLSRGIEQPIARRLLTGAFLADALANVSYPGVADILRARIDDWLDRHIGAAPEIEEVAL